MKRALLLTPALTSIPTKKRDKTKPRGSLKRTAILIALPIVLALFAVGGVGAFYHPPNCAVLGPWQQNQFHTLYEQFPTINQSKYVTTYLCDNPTFNFGEMTAGETVAQLGGFGVVEIHSLTAAEVSNSSVSASLNEQPGSFFFVGIADINTTAARVSGTCMDTVNPDPSLLDALNCMGVKTG